MHCCFSTCNRLPSVEKSTEIVFRLDLLGDVLAHLLGDVLALLPGHLPLNVPAVLHLRRDDMRWENMKIFIISPRFGAGLACTPLTQLDGPPGSDQLNRRSMMTTMMMMIMMTTMMMVMVTTMMMVIVMRSISMMRINLLAFFLLDLLGDRRANLQQVLMCLHDILPW